MDSEAAKKDRRKKKSERTIVSYSLWYRFYDTNHMYTNLYGQSKLLFIAQVDGPSSNKGGQINRKRWSIQQRRTKETVEYISILNSILLQLCVLTWTVRFIAKFSHIWRKYVESIPWLHFDGSFCYEDIFSHFCTLHRVMGISQKEHTQSIPVHRHSRGE